MSSRDLDKSPFHSQESILLFCYWEFRSSEVCITVLYFVQCTPLGKWRLSGFHLSILHPRCQLHLRRQTLWYIANTVRLTFSAMFLLHTRLCQPSGCAGPWRFVLLLLDCGAALATPRVVWHCRFFNIVKKKFVSPPCCGFNYLYTGGAACSNRLRQF